MEYLSHEQHKWTFEVTYHANQSIHWPGSDWKYNPVTHWVALNRTQWLCGPNLWPWLPLGWVGCCTLGFTLAHGSRKPNLQQTNISLGAYTTRQLGSRRKLTISLESDIGASTPGLMPWEWVINYTTVEMGNRPRFPSDIPLGHIWPTGRDIMVIFTQCCNDEQKN